MEQTSCDFQLDHVGFLYCSVVMVAAVFFSWPTYADCVDDFFGGAKNTIPFVYK